MELGIVTLTWVRPFLSEHVSLFERARRCGFGAIEIGISDPDALDLPLIRRHLDIHNMKSSIVVMLGPDTDISSDDAWRRDNGFDLVSRCIAAGAQLGATVVGGPIYGNQMYFAGRAPRHLTMDERRRRVGWCVEALRRLGDLAFAKSIKLAIEPVNRYETSLVNLVSHGKELLELVDHPALGIAFDTFHACMEESNICDAIRAAGRDLIHFQANENHRGVVGSGHIPWPEVGQALADVGFDGLVILEPFRRREQPLGSALALWRPPDRTDDDPSDAMLASGAQHLVGAFNLDRQKGKR
jgi:D-psicose/D-tagatose/L-ribulose 3-epimerase